MGGAKSRAESREKINILVREFFNHRKLIKLGGTKTMIIEII